jgi:hypothetical protein
LDNVEISLKGKGQEGEDMDWVLLAQGTDQSWVLLDMVMNLRVP